MTTMPVLGGLAPGTTPTSSSTVWFAETVAGKANAVADGFDCGPCAVMTAESAEVRPADAAWIVAVPAACAVNTALLPSPDATRSPAATPPVIATSDQVAAMFATNALPGSRAIA